MQKCATYANSNLILNANVDFNKTTTIIAAALAAEKNDDDIDNGNKKNNIMKNWFPVCQRRWMHWTCACASIRMI